MIELNNISVHIVGNKNRFEHLVKSKMPLELDESMKELMLKFFQNAFKADEYYHFYHASDLSMNEVFTYVTRIFENPESLHEESINLAQFLFDKSVHPKIKAGEFFTAYFQNCNYKGEIIDAIGLFKTENKDLFLKIKHDNYFFDLETDKGVNLNKLDKACFIYNTNKEDGYVLSIADKTNGTEAQFWTDEFLQVKQVEDEFYNTEKTMSVFKNYVEERMPEEFEMSRIDQADFLNRTMEFFQEQEEFETEVFSQQILQQPELIESFNNYKSEYELDTQEMLADHFGIAEKAVKKQTRHYKSIIKLDKNFHIYVHGDRSKIEQSEDSHGKFYKIYFQEES